jgi:hypothetical protein
LKIDLKEEKEKKEKLMSELKKIKDEMKQRLDLVNFKMSEY